MEEKNNYIAITIIERILKKKFLFLKVFLITFIVSCIIIMPVPRYYTSSVSLAPEIDFLGANNPLSSIASSFGFNMNSSSTGDAIFPELYPEVISSYNFIDKLIRIPVQTNDGTIKTTYYNYLDKHQKKNVLTAPFYKMVNFIKDLFKEKKTKGNTKTVDVFRLTKEQKDIFSKIHDNITCTNDPKTSLILISVKDQDPLIAATIADSVRQKLQDFITEYRTNKARIDVAHYKELAAEAKRGYEHARQRYGSFSDANADVVLQSYRLKENDLENDMQLRYNNYTMMQNQLQLSQAKLQEKTPAFTVVQSATVALKPAGPKRMIFVAIMLILSAIVTTIYINKDLLVQRFKEKA